MQELIIDPNMPIHRPMIHVRTKCDLVETTGGPSLEGLTPECLMKGEVWTSSVTGTGVAELKQKISEFLRHRLGTAEVVPSTAIRCRDTITKASEHLAAAKSLVEQNRDKILVAMELRAALEQLGQVLGATHTDDILDHVFSKFCIGK